MSIELVLWQEGFCVSGVKHSGSGTKGLFLCQSFCFHMLVEESHLK
jgi:hypothetical protein